MKKIKVSGVVTAAVLLFLGVFSVANLKLGLEPAKKFLKRETKFKAMAEEVRTGYTSDDFKGKSSFINLNGLFARTIGQRVCNDVVLLKNDMLTLTMKRANMEKQANVLAELADYTKKFEIPFLYVQAPYKEDKEDSLYPTGVESYAYENAEELLQLLTEKQVDTLDLRPYLCETPELINQYYNRTDHHWNFAGAFVGFQQIAMRLDQMFPEKNLDMTYTQPDQWESHTLEDWSLGSRGKRVGKWFAGVEDVTWYTPLFETEMSRTVPKWQNFFSGDFETANLRTKHIEEKDYFAYSTYSLYIGGDYPLVQHRNRKAVSDLHVLIIKDSYTSPVQAYLSTMITELDVIDPRHLTECTVAEYISRTKSDVVLVMMNPSVFGVSDYMSFGVDEALKAKEPELTATWKTSKDVKIEPSDNAYKQDSSITVKTGKTYTIRFKDVEFTDGTAEGVVISLYNTTTKTILDSGIFDLEYVRENGEFEWVFTTPKGSDKLCLRLYAGVPGETAGNGVVYKEVELFEWK